MQGTNRRGTTRPGTTRPGTTRPGTTRLRNVAVLALVPSLLALAGCTRFGATVSRPEDPVVLDGTSLPKLIGATVPSVVGFSWDGSAWQQVPVQVDERDMVSPGKIENLPTGSWPKVNGANYLVLAYTTPSQPAAGYTSSATFVGADSNPLFDANDQVSFLSNDTGKQAPGDTAAPANTLAGIREEVKATDATNAAGVGYVYLFESTSASLSGGSAGTTGVHYTFSLDSGDYKTTYKMGTGSLAPNNVWGFNPEHSTLTTGSYSETFGDRWLNNGETVVSGTPANTSMLERSRTQFAPGVCGRSEDTFDGADSGEGGFIANISGPVRAIRSYMGANSGKWTASTDIFYPQREDSITDLRVHIIPQIMGFDDMNTAVAGMRYSDDQNANVPIDGVPDTIVAGHSALWQMVSGNVGTVLTTHNLTTDITGLTSSTYYLDQKPASPLPCTGDNTAWGQNGIQITGPAGGIPCTDPTSADCPGGVAKTFVSTRTRYFLVPNLPVSLGSTYATRALAGFTTTVTDQT